MCYYASYRVKKREAGLKVSRKEINTIEEILIDTKSQMKEVLSKLRTNFKKIRTKNAHPDIISHIKIDYYGMQTNIEKVSNIAIIDNRTLSIMPWEKNLIVDIKKAILTSNLGLNPSISENSIIISMPPLSEEYRKKTIKLVHSESERGRVNIRGIRRDSNSAIRNLLKNKVVSEDKAKESENDVQKLTERMIENLASIVKEKEKNLMEM